MVHIKKESSFLGLETEERVCNGKITKGQKEILGVTDRFIMMIAFISNGFMSVQVYQNLYQIVQFKYVQFSVYQLDLNKERYFFLKRKPFNYLIALF